MSDEMSPRDVARASLPRGGNLGNLDNYVPAVVPPDPARDARVAARRAADARRAGAALDRLLAETWPGDTVARDAFRKGYAEGFHDGWSDGHAACEAQHKGHYGVPDVTGYNGRDPDTGRPLCEHNGDAETCDRDHLYPRFQRYVVRAGGR